LVFVLSTESYLIQASSTHKSVSVVSATPNHASGVASPASQVPKALVLEHPSHEKDEEGEAKVMLANVVDESDMSTLRISGLKPRISVTERGWGESTIELHVPSGTPIGELQTLLKEQALSKRDHLNGIWLKQARGLAT
jgi:hypothetical protein